MLREVWIGLSRTTGASGDLTQRRQGWVWADGSPYSTDQINVWYDDNPRTSQTYVFVHVDRWWGYEYQWADDYGICQRGKESSLPPYLENKINRLNLNISVHFCTSKQFNWIGMISSAPALCKILCTVPLCLQTYLHVQNG